MFNIDIVFSIITGYIVFSNITGYIVFTSITGYIVFSSIFKYNWLHSIFKYNWIHGIFKFPPAASSTSTAVHQATLVACETLCDAVDEAEVLLSRGTSLLHKVCLVGE